MDRDSLKEKIEKLGPWYQNITLDGIKTLRKRDTEKAWNRIESNFDIKFEGSRILDLGCNAGYYSFMAAKRGASVVGIEALDRAFEQAKFLKEYYEDIWNMKLDVTLIKKDISDIDFLSMGKFDYIFALAILYHVGNFKYGKGTERSFQEQDRVISLLVRMSDNFIVRARKRKRIGSEFYDAKHYNKVFGKYNFKPTKIIKEPKGNRILISYVRGKGGI